jgi:TPR repeat protein
MNTNLNVNNKYDNCYNLNDLNENEIKELKDLFKVEYFESPINKFSKKIYNLFVNGIPYDPTDSDDLYYMGVYYQYIRKNYDLAIKYYFLASDNGDTNATNNLGVWYQYFNGKSDDNLAEKYYIMAVNKENTTAMYNLGFFYYNKKKYDLMKKYLLMAIERGFSDAMYCLGRYYEQIEKNNDLAKKYYSMIYDSSCIET